MRASIFVSAAAFAAGAFAQSSSGDDFPQTSFLQQTDSLGVVTGQPAPATNIPNQPPAETNIPALDTSVGIPASIPAVGSGIQTIAVPGTANTTRTLVVSANNSTTVVLGDPTSAGGSRSAAATGTDGKPITTGATRTGSEASGSETSGTGAQSTGAAATMRAVAGGVAGVGAFVAAFL